MENSFYVYDVAGMLKTSVFVFFIFFFQAEDGIRDRNVTGVQTCALPIYHYRATMRRRAGAAADGAGGGIAGGGADEPGRRREAGRGGAVLRPGAPRPPPQIGRASCRERV